MIHIHSQTVKNHSDYKHFTFLNAVIDFFRLNLGLSYKFFYNVTFNISIVNQSLIHACSYLSVLIMFYYELEEIMSFPGSSMVKNPLALSETWVECWVGKIPWRRKWQPTPLFLPGQSHGQRSLVGYSPWHQKRVGHDLPTKAPPPEEILVSCFICIYYIHSGEKAKTKMYFLMEPTFLIKGNQWGFLSGSTVKNLPTM